MLIFVKGDYLRLIESGQKTTTIRPWRRCKLVPGGTLSFNGRVVVTLTRVEHRHLADLTDADARADGFASRAAFVRAFCGHYPAIDARDRATKVWVLHFKSPSRSDQRARAGATSAAGPA